MSDGNGLPVVEGEAAPWCVVLTNRCAERVVQCQLTKLGYEVYMPMLLKQVRESRRDVVVARPLLPGYLFVRAISVGERWRPIFSTQGVRSVFTQGAQPVLIGDRLLNAVRAEEAKSLAQIVAPPNVAKPQARVARSPCIYKPGDKVTIGLVEAIFDEVVDEKRVAVFSSVIGGDLRRSVVDLDKVSASTVNAH